jgi:DNA helicase-2/ATP-dependent DNA helicase PcrA
MTFKPSIFQSAIYDFIPNGKGNLIVDAVAGSGKTTTIVEALKLIPSDLKVIFVAFNKSIVNELSTKVPSHVEVKTMHSFGFGTVRFNMGKNVVVNNDKVMEIIKQLYQTWDIDETVAEGYMFRVRSLVDLARLNLASNIEELYDIAEHYNVEILNGEVEKAWIVYGVARNFKTMIDMTDMIYLPAYHKFKCKQYDWVFVDECQDFNKCQQEILKLMLKPTGRFIAVGDPRQAIYGFAGADAKSFQTLREIPNTISLPLSVNYRCGKKIIDLAQSIVPQLEAFENAIDGEVVDQSKWKDIQDGDFVLCRNVRPLLKLCMDLLIDGKKASVRGRDIGANLITMLKRAKTSKFDEAITRLYNESERTVQKSVSRGKNESEVRNSTAFRTNIDKIEALEIIAGELNSVEEVIKKLETLFTDSKDGIILSTIHKAKGLESKIVHILNPELMPSKWAKKDWERDQEDNLIYVAYTRAKEKLCFIVDYDGTK